MKKDDLWKVLLIIGSLWIVLVLIAFISLWINQYSKIASLGLTVASLFAMLIVSLPGMGLIIWALYKRNKRHIF